MNKILEVKNLQKWFPLHRGLLASLMLRKENKFIQAVDNVSFSINEAEIYGLVGESGCGKTTTGELIAKLLTPTSGTISFKGINIDHLKGNALMEFRKDLQMIFQDPYQSINSRFKIQDWVMEPLKIHNLGADRDRFKMVQHALELADLTPARAFMERYPHELSGGQKQRAAIARAIVMQPSFLVADEPTSMLDVSTRANILLLLESLRDRFNMSILFISHDLGVIRYICDRVAIMYLGIIVETGLTDHVLNQPIHPYTKALRAAVPDADPDVRRRRITLEGEVPDAIDILPGCRFISRCPSATNTCKVENPELREVEKNHFVACLNV